MAPDRPNDRHTDRLDRLSAPLFTIPSLTDTQIAGARHLVWFQNYDALLTDGAFWRKLWFTIQITFLAVAVELVLGLLCAIVLQQAAARGIGAFRMIVYIPMMLSPLVVAYFWRIMLDGSYGVLTWFADALGFGKPQWTVNLTLAKLSLVATDAWQWTPFVTLLMLAGLPRRSPGNSMRRPRSTAHQPSTTTLRIKPRSRRDPCRSRKRRGRAGCTMRCT